MWLLTCYFNNNLKIYVHLSIENRFVNKKLKIDKKKIHRSDNEADQNFVHYRNCS